MLIEAYPNTPEYCKIHEVNRARVLSIRIACSEDYLQLSSSSTEKPWTSIGIIVNHDPGVRRLLHSLPLRIAT